MLTLDISNYGGELSPQIVADWKAAGVQKVVVGIDLHAANITRARRQLAVARDGGMRLGAYREAYWRADVQTSMQLVAGALAGFNIEDVGLAFEDGDAPLVGYSTQELVCAWIQHNLDIAERIWGREHTCLYTAAWWWNPYTSSTHHFSDHKLWVADYNGIPDGTFAPFGGWTQCFRHQFRGSVDFCHYSVDVNFEEDDMADTEARQRLHDLEQWRAMAQAVLDQQKESIDALVTGNLWQQGVLDDQEKRLEALEDKK